jgi:hypothetical protein
VHELESNYNGKEREGAVAEGTRGLPYVTETTTNLGTIPELVVER